MMKKRKQSSEGHSKAALASASQAAVVGVSLMPCPEPVVLPSSLWDTVSLGHFQSSIPKEESRWMSWEPRKKETVAFNSLFIYLCQQTGDESCNFWSSREHRENENTSDNLDSSQC